MVEKITEKKMPEKFWQKLVDVYFQFYKTHFRDNDGFQLSPDWAPHKRGMEAKGLKGIIERLRIISEEKKIEWDESCAVASLIEFLEKAYSVPFYRKSFLCCQLNKFKDQIIVLQKPNNSLITKILELWYFEFPEYTREFDIDRQAAEKIISFIKEQFKNSSVLFSEQSLISTINVLIQFVKQDDFWKVKSLKSISYNIQELINKIKSKHGTDKAFSREGLAEEFNRRYKK